MRLHGLVVFKLLLASIALPAQSSPAGIWSDATLTLVLQTDGEKLTGTVKDERAEPHAISNGIVDGNKLRFTTAAMLNGKDVVIEWTGDLMGDELTLTRVIPSAPSRRPTPFNGPFVLRRSK